MSVRVPTVNRVLFAGRLKTDPSAFGSSPNQMVTFAVTSQDPKRPVTVNVVVRGVGADFCNSFRAGQAVMVEGRIGLREWTDRQGNTRKNTEIHALWVEPLE